MNTKFILLSSCALVLFNQPAFSATLTWTGATNSNWATGTNWGGTAPTSADTTNIANTATSPIVSAPGATAADVRLGSAANAASLTINSTGVLTDANGYVGYAAGSTATATVTGSSAQWISTTQLFLSQSATANGTLNVLNGGTVTSASVRIGQAGTATATIDGAGSLLASTTAALYVGNAGNGTLNVQNGGKVTAGANIIIASNAASTSSTTVTGANSQILVTGGLTTGSAGNGTLNITNGGYVSNTGSGIIAGGSTSTSTVTVNGTNSRWVNSAGLFIGQSGNATLNIQAGGVVSSASGLSVGQQAVGTGTINVTGTGSQMNNATSMRIGDLGTASLNILNGATVTNGPTAIGYFGVGSTTNNTATGNLLISGAGSTLNNPYLVHVGFYGNGSVNINNGGTLNGGASYIGTNAGSNGTATVSDAGSSWTSIDNFVVGSAGTGTLNITNGGLVSDVTGILGRFGGTGTSTITGANSNWVNSTDFYIGGEGNGTLTLQNGGALTVNDGGSYIYKYADGTSFNKISDSTIYIAVSAGSTGTLNIGAAALSAAAAAGTTNAKQILFGAGTGTIVFNHTGTNYEFASDIIGNGTLNFVAGNTLLTGDNTAFTGNIIGSGAVTINSGETVITTNSSTFAGTTNVTGGTLRVNGSLGGTTNVSGTGRLQGNSNMGNIVINSGGTVAPGNSIGTTNTVNTTFNPGSTYEVEVNSAGQSDKINASGTATLNGGTVKAIPYPDFIANTPYTILTATGGVTGAFDGTTDDYQFIDSFLTQDANNVYLTVTANTAALRAAARTPNQKAIVNLINDPGLNANAAVNALYLSADANDLDANLDALSGEIHASLDSAFISDQRLLRQAVLGDDIINDNQSFEGASGRLFFHSFGAWSDTDQTFNTAQTDHRTTGFLVGAEKKMDQSRAGIAVGISHTDLDQDSLGAKADSNNYHALAYTGTNLTDKDKVTVGASYTFHQTDTSRDMDFGGFSGSSDADYHSQTGQVFGEIAHAFQPDFIDKKVKTEVYAQGAYIVNKSEGFREDGEAGLDVKGATDDVATSTLGVRVHKEIETNEKRYFTVLGGLAWQHAYGEDDPKREVRFNNATGTDRAGVSGMPIDRDAALVTAGTSVYIKPNLTLNVSYDGAYSSDTTQHGVFGHINWKF